jgi:hypothetical protein
MHRTASHILSAHKGELTLGASHYNFQIIGTFGKVLTRLKSEGLSFGGNAMQLGALQQCVTTALSQAKAEQNEHFYLYICENIAELGIMVNADLVLPAIDQILRDLGLVAPTPGVYQPPFRAPFIEQARKSILQGLANMRALHRQDVDRYLINVSETQEPSDLYYRVTNDLAPNFRLANFYSWAIEQLMFHLFTRYHKPVGKDILAIFLHAARQSSAEMCLWVVASETLDMLSALTF